MRKPPAIAAVRWVHRFARYTSAIGRPKISEWPSVITNAHGKIEISAEKPATIKAGTSAPKRTAATQANMSPLVIGEVLV